MRYSVSDLKFRPLEDEDVAAAAALVRAAFAEQGVETDPPSSAHKESAASIARKLFEGGGMGAWAEDELLGLVLWSPDGDTLYLGRLAVHPHGRGRGLARRLLALAEAEARRLGFAKTRLRVRLALPANRRLFAALGYVEAGTGAHPGYDRPTFVVMEKTA